MHDRIIHLSGHRFTTPRGAYFAVVFKLRASAPTSCPSAIEGIPLKAEGSSRSATSSLLNIFSPGPVLNYRRTAFSSALRPLLLLLFSQTDIRSPGALRLSLLAFRGRLTFLRFLLL